MKQIYLILSLCFFSTFSFGQIPPNDEIQNALEITILPFTDNDVQTQNATATTSGTANGCDVTNFKRVYYRIKPSENISLEVEILNQNNGEEFIVFYSSSEEFATSDSQLTAISPCEFGLVRAANLVANQVYYIQLSSITSETTIQFIDTNDDTIVNIPDANFKAALLAHNPVIDTNGDGEIQLYEAYKITKLNLNSKNISDLTGLEAFVNLLEIDAADNAIVSVDLSKNISLVALEIFANNLSAIDVSNNTELQILDISVNRNISTLDVTNNTKLRELKSSVCNISVIDVSNNGLLEVLWFDFNNISAVDVTNNAELEELSLSNNKNINTLNVTNNIKLKRLNVWSCSLSELDVSNNLLLESLDVDNNNLSAVDVTNNTELKDLGVSRITNLNTLNLTNNVKLEKLKAHSSDLSDLDLSDNLLLELLVVHNNNLSEINLINNINLDFLSIEKTNLSEIDLSKNNLLRELWIGNDNISELDLTNNINLERLIIDPSFIKSLDLSSNVNLVSLSMDKNQFLKTINFKNGNNSLITNAFRVKNCPNLQTICVDDVDYALTNFINVDPQAVFTDDCSVTDVNYNSIEGTLTYDDESNGCDTGDIVLANQLVKATDGTNEFGTFTDSSGFYDMSVVANTYETSIQNIPSHITINPATISDVFTSFGNTETADFCINANEDVNDVNIALLPLREARPGFDTKYQLVYENMGVANVSGDITFTFDNTMQNFLSANPIEANSTLNTLTFNYVDLKPFEIRTIDIEMNTFPPPTVNGDDILNLSAVINPITGDQNPDDNTFNLEQIVVNSYDPNDKRVLQGPEIELPQASAYLDYIIRFQNTGTASAINVVITDELTSKLDWETLRPVSSSHPYSFRSINGGFLEFSFNDINLPAQQDDDAGSNGFIAFKIKPKSDVAIGDIMFGRSANIYFDFNAPILTNTVQTEIVTTLGTSIENVLENAITLYPNPVTNSLKIKTNKVINDISLYSFSGQLIYNSKENLDKINFEEYTKGVYFLKIKTENGILNKRIIKK